MNRRKSQRMNISCPVAINVLSEQGEAESLDISCEGLRMISSFDIKDESSFQMKVDMSSQSFEGLEGKVKWKRFLDDKNSYEYGVEFLNGKDVNLCEVLDEITQTNTEDFLGVKLPKHISEGLKGQYINIAANKSQIMQAIDFAPPFLRIDKMVVYGDKTDTKSSYGIGIGTVTLDDTEGHYNSTIFLAMCGKFMGMAASIHLGLLYPHTAPQVVEVDHIVPAEKDIWRPSEKGSVFFVETKILRQKLQMSVMDVKISFGNILMGYVDKLKLVLTPKDSIYHAGVLPD